jgi:cytochrome c oxidase subunit 2
MSGLIITTLVILVFIVIYQIAQASEYTTILRGEKQVNLRTNRLMAWLLVIFFILGLIGIYQCHVYLMDKMLPEPASIQGEKYESMSLATMIILGIVFFATQITLFYFIFRYQYSEKRKAYFYTHNYKLEILWTTIPAITLIILVVVGLKNWFHITGPAPKDSLIVEVVGKQFNWIIHYPGPDGVLGKRDFRLISDANNVIGLDWSDPYSKDDIIMQNGEMHIIKDRPVHLVINSRDVVHDVGLPHFRMKMDAVPGITTTMWFTPTITTKEMQKKTKNPNFVYEIACDQLCGKGHYSMRGTVVVQTAAAFKSWIAQQKSYYSQNVEQKPDATQGTATSDSTAKAKTPLTASL